MISVTEDHIAREARKQGLTFKLQRCEVSESLRPYLLPASRFEILTGKKEGTAILR